MTTIYRVDEYHNLAAIRSVVEDALEKRPDVASVLSRSDRPPLVVVKPNWIQDSHEYDHETWEPVITHPALVITVIEALARRMKGGGDICLCDAPNTYADFPAIIARGGLGQRIKEMGYAFPAVHFEIMDLRREVWLRKEEVTVERRPNVCDPRGYVAFNLGRASMIFNKAPGNFYGADYDSSVVNIHHHGDTHEYLLAGTPVACDLFINLPKLKTHKKTGITCCLKNLVGINGDKNWLPHFVQGTPASGGDEFDDNQFAHRLEAYIKTRGRKVALAMPSIGTYLYRKTRNLGKTVLGDSEKVVRNGNWQGNDTCWRMALDLNRALLYGNRDGTFREPSAPKPYLAIVDGIVGGEGNGPICPSPISSRVIISGGNPAEVDAAACRLMGYDPTLFPIVANSFNQHEMPITTASLAESTVHDGRIGEAVPLAQIEPAAGRPFKPHFGWPKLTSPGSNR